MVAKPSYKENEHFNLLDVFMFLPKKNMCPCSLG